MVGLAAGCALYRFHDIALATLLVSEVTFELLGPSNAFVEAPVVAPVVHRCVTIIIQLKKNYIMERNFGHDN
jgi:hypothetical protein